MALSKSKIKKLKSRLDTLRLDRSNIEGIWEYIEQFVVPFKSALYENWSESSVNWRRWGIYDSTAVISNQILASNIHSGLTNFSYRWLDFTFKGAAGRVLNKMQRPAGWLQENSEAVFDGISESNFNVESNESYLDISSFGTAHILKEVEVRNNSLDKFVFTAVPSNEAHFEDDYKGQPVYWFRELKWTATQIFSKFDKKTIPEETVKRLEAKDTAGERVSVIFAIYPRKGRASSQYVQVRSIRPWGGCYFLESDLTQLGDEDGYYDFPVYIPRWRTTSGSRWGHSPAFVVLGDILTLNELVKLVLTSAEKVIDPANLVTRRGIFGNVNLGPGDITVVADIEKSLRPYESGARFDVSSLTKSDLQQSIKEAYYTNRLEIKKSPQQTATEVHAQFELMSRLLGPTHGRLLVDWINPMTLSSYGDMFRYKVLAPPPPEVQDAQAEMKVEYHGPMARAQKMDEVQSIERLIGSVAQVSEKFPDALDIIDIDEAVYNTAKFLGVPPEIIRDKTKIGTVRRLKKQVQELSQQIEMMQGAAGAAKDGAQAVASLEGTGQQIQGLLQ